MLLDGISNRRGLLLSLNFTKLGEPDEELPAVALEPSGALAFEKPVSEDHHPELGPTETQQALLDDLTARFWGRLKLFAARRLRDPAAAEDAAQETLQRVIAALEAGRLQNPEALPGFVFSTVRHVCLQWSRKHGREDRALEKLGGLGGCAVSTDDPLARLIREERRITVRGALEHLESADQELLRMFYSTDLEPGEIAARLGLQRGALRVRKHRALRRLRKLLEGHTGNAGRSMGTL